MKDTTLKTALTASLECLADVKALKAMKNTNQYGKNVSTTTNPAIFVFEESPRTLVTSVMS